MGDKISTTMVKELRSKTGAGVVDCYSILRSCGGDLAVAEGIIRKRRIDNPTESTAEGTRTGYVHSYVHIGDRIGVMVEVECGTDFAARTDEFKTFVHDLAIHIAAMKPSWVSPEDVPWEDSGSGEIDSARYLLLQPFIKDPSRTIGELLTELSDRIGEPCIVRRFVRWEAGEEIPEETSQPLEKSKGIKIAFSVIILLALVASLILGFCQ